MASDILLVTGIHRDELEFGDRVAALIDPTSVDVLRIPEGISRARFGGEREFYLGARHREIYLQLQQQVQGRYRLLIDLHSGLDENGPCADIFCHDASVLSCLAGRLPLGGDPDRVRLIEILGRGERLAQGAGNGGAVAAGARTWIPRAIWASSAPVYVGLEVFLKEDGEGDREDWQLALGVIGILVSCVSAL